MRRPSPSASAHQELGLNFLPLPSLLSACFPGLHGGRDGLPQHLAPYSLESLRELFAASDPLSREGRRQVWGGRRS